MDEYHFKVLRLESGVVGVEGWIDEADRAAWKLIILNLFKKSDDDDGGVVVAVSF